MIATLAADDLNHYGALGVLLLIGLAFALGSVVMSTIIGPSRHGPVKGSVYESGVNPLASVRRRFNVRFYIVAMTYLLFAVEIVFLVPWAVTFPSLGGSEGDTLAPLFLGRMLFFILTSVIAFVYAWRKGVFRYD